MRSGIFNSQCRPGRSTPSVICWHSEWSTGRFPENSARPFARTNWTTGSIRLRDSATFVVNQEIVVRFRDNLLSVLLLHVPCERPDSELRNHHSHIRFPINVGTKLIESQFVQAAGEVGRLQPPLHPDERNTAELFRAVEWRAEYERECLAAVYKNQTRIFCDIAIDECPHNFPKTLLRVTIELSQT